MSLYNDDYKEEVELSDKKEYVFTNLSPSTVYNLELYDITDGSNKKLYSANYLTMDKDNNSANIINSRIENKQLFLNVKYEGEGIDFVTVDIIENGKSILLYEGLPKDEFIIDLNDESSDIKCKIFINGKVAHFSQFVNEIEPDNEPENDPGGNEPGKEEDPGQEPETNIPVESITLDKSTLNLKVGEEYTLTATILPDDATDKSVIWESSDETVATVADGKVTGVAEGSAAITVKTPDGTISKTCNVAVEANAIPVEIRI